MKGRERTSRKVIIYGKGTEGDNSDDCSSGSTSTFKTLTGNIYGSKEEEADPGAVEKYLL